VVRPDGTAIGLIAKDVLVEDLDQNRSPGNLLSIIANMGQAQSRRPGYAISVEPGLTFRRGHSALTVGVPVAVYRNRTRSYADKISGGHGDAAFADYLLIVGYSRLF